MREKLLAAACAIPLLAAGCRQPLPEPELRGRIAAAAAEREAFESLMAAYDLSVSGRQPGGRKRKLRCSGRLAAVKGTGLRMRGTKILGMANIFDLLLAGDRVKLNFIHGRKYYEGSLSKIPGMANIFDLLLVDGKLEPVKLIFPTPPLEGPGAPELVMGHREVELIWRRSGGAMARKTVLASWNARPIRTEIYGEDGLRVALIRYYKPLEAGGLHPAAGFKINGAPPGKMRVNFELGDLRVNETVKDAAFKLKAVKGYEVIDLDAKKPDAAFASPPSAEKQ